uniref:Uncharacterized protein n=1 Tax=Anguilla anguilla TaxID=7936 RepID=A0A0E9TEU5_ANGAN
MYYSIKADRMTEMKMGKKTLDFILG